MKYKYYDGGKVQLSRELIVKPNDVIDVNKDDPYYDLVVNSTRFTLVDEKTINESTTPEPKKPKEDSMPDLGLSKGDLYALNKDEQIRKIKVLEEKAGEGQTIPRQTIPRLEKDRVLRILELQKTLRGGE